MTGTMAHSSPFSPGGRFGDWRLATQSIIGFWAFYLVTVLIRGLFGPEAASAISYRAINAAIGLVLTFLIYVAIRMFARDGSIRRMAIVAAVAALPAAMLNDLSHEIALCADRATLQAALRCLQRRVQQDPMRHLIPA